MVLAELLQKGFCALDVYGIVRAFEGALPPAAVDETDDGVDRDAADLPGDERRQRGTWDD